MSWRFWEKKQEERLIYSEALTVPAEHVRRVCELQDAYAALPKGQDKVAHHDLWAYIADIFPQVRYGRWRLEHKNAFTVWVVPYSCEKHKD